MRLYFKSVTLHNFMSFSHTTVDLNEMGYVLVSGQNNCKLDNALSNGSGKSSIFNGICYALTGETTQGLSQGIENIFADPNDCWVELRLNVDNDEFVIRRIRTPRTDMKIFINDEDKSGKGIKESEKILASYVPDLTSELVGSIIILGQGLPRRFTNNKPARRKEILETLTKSDFMIQSIRDKLDVRLEELKINLQQKNDSNLAATSQLSVYAKQLESYNSDLADYEACENIDLKISELTSSIEKDQELVNQKSNEMSSLSEISQQETDNLSKLTMDKMNKLVDIKKVYKQKAEPIDKESQSLGNQKYMLEHQLKDVLAKPEVCPTCGKPMDDWLDPTPLQNELNQIEDKLKDVNAKKAELKKLEDSEAEEIENKFIADKKKISDKLEELKTSNAQCLSEISALQSLITKNSSEVSKLKLLKDNYQRLLENINETTKCINDLNDQVTLNNALIIDINSHINVVQQMITLAKREFRGILLQNVITYINAKVKQYSQEVFGTDLLSFTLNENNIDISYMDKLYESLSGGERQKIDVIVQLALRDLLSNQLGIHSNLLTIDEIFDNLDAIGCTKILNLISNLRDIESVFIITHHKAELDITYDSELRVEKNEHGISTVYNI